MKLRKVIKNLKKIKFRLPKRIEVVLIAIAIFLLFWADVLQNKAIDFGLDYKVHLTESVIFTSISAFWFVLIFYHITLLTLFVYSILQKGTHYFWDFVIGVLASFGIGVIMTGAITGVYDIKQIPFFTFNLGLITFYHIFGIFPQIIAMFYFAFTE